MNVGQPHIGLAFLAKQFLMIGDVEHRDAEFAPGLLQIALGT